MTTQNWLTPDCQRTRHGQTGVFDRGLQALRWLVGVQTSQHGHLRPIGSNGFYRHNGARADFDQQPLRRRPRSRPVSKLSARQPTGGGTNKPNSPSTGSSAGTISERSSTAPDRRLPRRLACRPEQRKPRGESMLAFLMSLTEMRQTQNTARAVQPAAFSGKRQSTMAL